MIVDGKKIAENMLESLGRFVREQGISPTLLVLTATPDFATQSFLRIKARAAARVGVHIELQEFGADITTEDVIAAIETARATCDGIILQLPFPAGVDVEKVLSVLPQSHDVDAIGKEARAALGAGVSPVLPPVVGAIDAICTVYGVALSKKRAVVVGHGRLVGGPVSLWLRHKAADVTVVERDSADIDTYISDADVLVLGAGVPRLVSPAMIKEGVILFDAGTSEDGGKLAGDADPACASRASVFTPVPGGIGPITISVLFKNLLVLRYGYTDEVPRTQK